MKKNEKENRNQQYLKSNQNFEKVKDFQDNLFKMLKSYYLTWVNNIVTVSMAYI